MSQEGLPPRDSWIELAAKTSYLFDVEEITKNQKEQTRQFHQIRGNLLAAGYNIERALDRLLLVIFVPPELHKKGPQASLFDGYILKGHFMSFANKIETLKNVIPYAEDIDDDEGAEIVKRLNEVRTIRNNFAHYPIVFFAKGPEPIKNLLPVLKTKKSKIELNNEILDQYINLFDELGENLENVIRKYEVINDEEDTVA